MMKKLIFIFSISAILYACGSDDEDSTDQTSTVEDAVAQEILKAHNNYRSDVGIANLTWDEEIAKSAQAWADELASNCDFKHSGNEYGENIWAGTEGAYEPTEVVNSWGSEIDDYDYDTNTCATGKACGHYTQIVWENSTKIGCGTATCNGRDIWVCQYDPPGNYVGEKPY